MDITLKEKVIKKDYCVIHYWIKKNNTNPWVIFLHGAGTDHRVFDKQIHIIPEFFNILLIDIRGHGLSRPTGRTFSIKLVVDDLITIMNIEHCDEAILVGLSMGGTICQELALYHSSRVKSLVLIGCMLNTSKVSLIEKVLLKSTPILFSLYPWSILKKLIANLASRQLYVQNYLINSLNNISKKDFINFFYETNKSLNYSNKYKVDKDTLLILGEKDIIKIVKDSIPYISSSVLCNKYLIIKDARHYANQDNPKVFNDLLINFLNKNRGLSKHL